MASESLDSSDSSVRDRGQRATTPDAVRGSSGPAARPAWFPLGYREGFSQWVRVSAITREQPFFVVPCSH